VVGDGGSGGSIRLARGIGGLKPTLPFSAIMTCPSLIFPTSAIVGKNPSSLLCFFCNPSMNGKSASVALRIKIGTRAEIRV